MNKTFDSDFDRTYKECVTATLPLASSASPTQDLILSKVKIHKSAHCFVKVGVRNENLDDFICVSEILKNDGSSQIRDDDSTRVLICSTIQQTRSR